MNEYVVHAKELIAKTPCIAVATASTAGVPWNSPVFAVHDESYNFYWSSLVTAQHSRNLRENPQVFLVIYDSVASDENYEGVYIQATVEVLESQVEISKALSLLHHQKSQPSSADFLPGHPTRIYKAVAEHIWANVTKQISGKFIDERVEIKLI